jgi:DNA polymerase III sliding clamp (beta) subunit (PCNA family)
MSENNSILLPANLSHVTRCCAADSRYALAAVRLMATDDGYRIEATDGKRLARVDGANAGNPDRFPEIPALMTAPNGASEALIPAKIFAKACKDVNTRLAGPEERRALAIRLGQDMTTLATIDEDGGSLVRQPRNVAGRFPDTDRVMPTAEPLASIMVDATLLAELLQVAAQFADRGYVTIDLFSKGPARITGKNASQNFTGLIMPVG